MRRFVVLLAGLAAAGVGVGCDSRAGAPPGRGARPNLILILVDTLRADRLGAYGSTAGLTPTMDAIASEGVVFESAIAPAPWTLPAVASLFCGYYPSVHKATDYKTVAGRSKNPSGTVRVFSDRFVTLAEALQKAGYATAAFSANPFIKAEHGFGQGFDLFRFLGDKAPGDQVNEAALRWLAEREAGKPFFLYLHYMEPHAPYDAADELLEPLLGAVELRAQKRALSQSELAQFRNYYRKSMVRYAGLPRHQNLWKYAEYWAARYDAAVRQADVHLGALRARLQERGVWDGALVVLLADHGEALGEHQWWGHGTCAYHNQLHVPLVIRYPGRQSAGRRFPQLVRLFDVLPTLLEQGRAGSLKGIQARSLRPLLDGLRDEPRFALAESVNTQPGLKALLSADWKLLAQTDRQTYALFNLAADPGELSDLAAREPQRLAELRSLLETRMRENAELGKGIQAGEVEISPEGVQQLGHLGYLGDASHEDEPADDSEPPSQQEDDQP